MDLRSVIEEKNREAHEAAAEEQRRLASRKQPLLAESSELSNLMAGERGKANRTPENLERYEELGRQIRELDQRILEVRNKADAVEREPLDVDALLKQAKVALEDAKRLRKWASYQAFYLPSKPYAQDIETAEARIAQLTAFIERCELALEAQAEFKRSSASGAREEVTA
jgi:hypothetical protein